MNIDAEAEIEKIGNLTRELIVNQLHDLVTELKKSSMLDTQQAAQYIGCSVRQLQRLDIPRVKLGEARNAKVRWRITDLDNFLNNNTIRN